LSLIIGVFVPTGIVISGDSRTTLNITGQAPNPNNSGAQITVQTSTVASDAAEKLFILHRKYGVGIFGDAVINNLTIAHYIEHFQIQHVNAPQNTQALANDLLTYFRSIQPTPNIGCMVAGYDGQIPWLDAVSVQQASSTRVNVDPQNNLLHGCVRGGDTPVVDRLLSQQQFNPIFPAMNLQDAVDFSRHLIRTTIDQMRFEPRPATVGGTIDTLIVTNREARFLAQKSLIAR
jgi:hypothetical protein